MILTERTLTPAMVNMPLQEYTDLYSPVEALARGSLFPDLEKPLAACPAVRKLKGNQAENDYSAASFALHELRLYLDTHPTCEKTLAEYKAMLENVRALRECWEKQAGMIDWGCCPNGWDWAETPFPWARKK